MTDPINFLCLQVLDFWHDQLDMQIFVKKADFSKYEHYLILGLWQGPFLDLYHAYFHG